jgi:acyl-coenzyme A synthetase/AMP-(fatty) acid ligase
MDLGAGVRVLQLAPLSFDASVFELFGPLLNGGTVVLTDPGQSFVDRVLGAVGRAGTAAPNALVLITPQLHLLVDHHPEALDGVEQLIFGGDVASVEHIRRARAALDPATRLIHAYGPTESTVIATTWPVDVVPDRASLPIGRPIENTQAYVLDEHQQLVPIGAEGELCIGGDGLADGYLNRPELTARAFVAHPFSDEPGARLYRTGDRCRWLADGTIEFLGRRDGQVKVRGHRIELGEVEAVLHRHPGVRQCVVVAREASRDRALVAYVVPRSPDLAVAELRRHAAAALAGAMCPSAYVLLDQLPMTRNGKVDRDALPEPGRPAAEPTDPDEPADALTAAEQLVTAAFRLVLELDAVGLDDEFADLGGTSLLFVDLHARIDEAHPGRIDLADVVEAGTARRIARMLGD